MIKTISKILAVIVTLVGIMVMFGWTLDIQSLKSILPIWVTMKFSTALCFALSGVVLFVISFSVPKPKAVTQIILRHS